MMRPQQTVNQFRPMGGMTMSPMGPMSAMGPMSSMGPMGPMPIPMPDPSTMMMQQMQPHYGMPQMTQAPPPSFVFYPGPQGSGQMMGQGQDRPWTN